MRRAARVTLAAVLVAATLLDAPPPARAEDPTAAGAEHLAATHGGTATDYELVHERSTALPDGAGVSAAKYVNLHTGHVYIVQRGPDGTIAGPELLETSMQVAAAALPALDTKADPALREAVAQAAPGASLPVAIWVEADAAAAEQTVIAAHPEVAWQGDQPIVESLEQARALRTELWEARHAAYAAAQEPVRLVIEAHGGSVAYASTSAPLLFADLPAEAVAAVAELPEVASLGSESEWKETMTNAGAAVQADWSIDYTDEGHGVRVGVVEYHNVRNSGDLGGQVLATYSTSGTPAYTSGFDHPSWVAGAIASLGTYGGVAPGADIVSAGTGGYCCPGLGTDRAIIAAADWAVAPWGGNVDLLTLSIAQDTATGAEEARRYFDSVVAEHGRLVVASAGNFSTFGSWNVTSPGTAYNVLTVGGTDDRNTPGYTDDISWFAGGDGSAYHDPPGTPWNVFGDFNKPNVSAPAVTVRTANGLTASGTSVATPIVAGIAAQIIARYPGLVAWPEGLRAIIMAGASNHSEMPDGSISSDHEGVGTASSLWSNRILTQSDGYWGGYRLGAMGAADQVSQQIAVRRGQLVRVALAWNSHTSGATLSKSDRLMADLDLRVVLPGGGAVGSFSFDNAYEWVEFIAPASGTATISVTHDRFESASERYSLAWVKRTVGTTERQWGPDRYATAAAISAAHFAPGVPAAYITTGENFPDALAGAPAAAISGAPILLVRRDSIPSYTDAELSRLRPGRIVVLGGPGAISDEVAVGLARYSSGGVSRLWGPDRYDTASAISAAHFPAGVHTVYIATGERFPDALTGAAVAGRDRAPVLLVRLDSIPAATHHELSRLRPGRIVILGGPGAVSDEVLVGMGLYSSNVTRLWGADRYSTATAISGANFGTGVGKVYVATGWTFPDSLAAAPVASMAGVPVLLTPPNALPAGVAAELRRLDPATIIFAGGPGAVSDEVRAAISALWE